MTDIYIHGVGAVSPQPTLDNTSFLDEVRETDQGYLPCVEPDYKEYIPPRMARRMSRVIKMGVASARISLDDAGIEVPEAIITGTGLGCLQDTEKFLSGMIDNEEEMLNPTAFMQSTHNTIGAQIALLLKCYEYNYTYVNRGFSFENALQDGLLQLADGGCDNLLVGGFDEFTDNFYAITKRLGCWQENASSSDILTSQTAGAIPGEGSTFFVLSNKKQTHSSHKPYAQLKGLSTVYRPEGIGEVEQRLHRLLDRAELSLQDIDLVVTGANGDAESDRYYHDLQSDVLPSVRVAAFKHLCGEYHTASAFGLWLCAKMLKEQHVPERAKMQPFDLPRLNNVLLYNHYKGTNHSLVLVGSA
jgi:3-oxoacyl-(acyl-carrier-protein) synthase